MKPVGDELRDCVNLFRWCHLKIYSTYKTKLSKSNLKAICRELKKEKMNTICNFVHFDSWQNFLNNDFRDEKLRSFVLYISRNLYMDMSNDFTLVCNFLLFGCFFYQGIISVSRQIHSICQPD